MIPKILTALISAAILSAVLGALPCEATGAKHRDKPKATTTDTRPAGNADLNSPATNFSGVRPVIELPDPNHVAPGRNKNEFFNQGE